MQAGMARRSNASCARTSRATEARLKLYANENFPRQVVERLRELGHDVLTTVDTGQANQRTADPEVLALASSLGRALLTRNRRDFRHLHNAGPDHCGIVLCSDEIDFVGQAERIHAALSDAGADLRARLVQVTRPQV